MKIALICQGYVPQTTSCAVQMRDLANEMVTLGHEPIMLVPSHSFSEGGVVEIIEGVKVYRLSALKNGEVNLFSRAIAEALMPITMLISLLRMRLPASSFDGVVWYSPSIFFGPLAWYLTWRSKCKGYLILRDMFPEWAVDLGIMKKGVVYKFFKAVANFQYSIADSIGVQSESNLGYLDKWNKSSKRIDVLSNWLSSDNMVDQLTSLDLSDFGDRKLFAYIGNMGVAQGMDIFLNLAETLQYRSDIGFVFVGRGSEKNNLIRRSMERNLENTFFHDEIKPEEITKLLSYCKVGLIGLDPKHNSHNIPGKFLAYLRAGLPVLARINAGTDLMKIITAGELGAFYTGENTAEFAAIALKLIDNQDQLVAMAKRGVSLYESDYQPTIAAKQIISALGC